MPYFIITIDTEGDNLWNKPQIITTENSKFLPRFQALCEKFQFKPSWLTNYEMAKCEVYTEFAKDVIARKTGEIGMHLHAWNSPPLNFSLSSNDLLYQPYLIEYPLKIIEEKIAYMTRLLQDTFNIDIVSHRAGRWAFNEDYAKLLMKYGYKVDCSVTPYISWKDHPGSPSGNGGSDYTTFPNKAYWINKENIQEESNSTLLEIPLTVMLRPVYENIQYLYSFPIISGILSRYTQRHMWLRPNGKNLKSLMTMVKKKNQSDHDYIEFMLHSSELMPGGSPYFKTERDIENLYMQLEELFGYIHRTHTGCTLIEYYNYFLKKGN